MIRDTIITAFVSVILIQGLVFTLAALFEWVARRAGRMSQGLNEKLKYERLRRAAEESRRLLLRQYLVYEDAVELLANAKTEGVVLYDARSPLRPL